jgi:hypothetical protein
LANPCNIRATANPWRSVRTGGELLEAGNGVMGVWLGKQLLGVAPAAILAPQVLLATAKPALGRMLEKSSVALSGFVAVTVLAALARRPLCPNSGWWATQWLRRRFA